MSKGAKKFGKSGAKGGGIVKRGSVTIHTPTDKMCGVKGK